MKPPRDEFTSFDHSRILLPVGGAGPDERLANLVCRIARRNGATVHAVSIVEVPRGQALTEIQARDAEQADRWIDRIRDIATKFEVVFDGSVVQAREAGPAIIDEEQSWNADLVILAIPYREKFERLAIGKTAEYILTHSRCEVLALRGAKVPAGAGSGRGERTSP